MTMIYSQIKKLIILGVLGAIIFLILNKVFNLSAGPSDSWPLTSIQDRQVEKLPICKIPGLKNKTQFYDYFNQIDLKCKSMKFFGKADGRKRVCLDKEFEMTPGDCTVLSFGINNEWSFDDEFERYGCKVYSFDPTMGKEDHNRSKNIRFFNLGIGNIKGQRKVGMSSKFTMLNVDRYENILDRLNLTNKKIDYIKLDVEISELEFFQDLFRNSPHLIKNIKQLAVELHHGYFGEAIYDIRDKIDEMGPMSAYQLFWQYFQEFKCHGFKLFEAGRRGAWTEVVWGNPY